MNKVLGDRFAGEEPPIRFGMWVPPVPDLGFVLAEAFAKEMNATCKGVRSCAVPLKNYKPGKCQSGDKCPRMAVPR